MRLAADANVLLSAVLGGRARLVFASPLVESVFTTASVLGEVHEYTVMIAAKKKLKSETVLLAVAALPVTVIEPGVYRRKLREARDRIGSRDPDDVDLLALALHFRTPVWSNDRDFESARVPWFDTASLLARLGIS